MVWCGPATSDGTADILLLWRYTIILHAVMDRFALFKKIRETLFFFVLRRLFCWRRISLFCRTVGDAPKIQNRPLGPPNGWRLGPVLKRFLKRIFYHANLLLHKSSGTEHSGLKTGAPHFLARFVPNSFLIGSNSRSRTKFLRLIKNFKSPGVV